MTESERIYRIAELERELQQERDALQREREISAMARKRCEWLEHSVRQAYRLAVGGRPLEPRHE